MRESNLGGSLGNSTCGVGVGGIGIILIGVNVGGGGVGGGRRRLRRGGRERHNERLDRSVRRRRCCSSSGNSGSGGFISLSASGGSSNRPHLADVGEALLAAALVDVGAVFVVGSRVVARDDARRRRTRFHERHVRNVLLGGSLGSRGADAAAHSFGEAADIFSCVRECEWRQERK